MLRFMGKIRLAAGVGILSLILFVEANAQNHLEHLLNNLRKLGYSLTREEVVALKKIDLRFDTKNRLDILERILTDREGIHGLKDANYFDKTETIRNALLLLDEHNLPSVRVLIEKLNDQEPWEKREKMVLAFISAKRDIRYKSNVAYLINTLPQYAGDLERVTSEDVSWAIMDVCNSLSYLSDLFVYKGDPDLLGPLFTYALRAYGYPAEYLSNMFVDMFIKRPEVFISVLAEQSDLAIHAAINALVSGIWNHEFQKKVNDVLKGDLSWVDDREKHVLKILADKVGEKNGRPEDGLPQKKSIPQAHTGG